MMATYRMRPVEKEAWPIRQLLETPSGQVDRRVWRAMEDGIVRPYGGGLQVHTAEGVMTAGEDDYLVLGLENEWYPVMRSVFEKTYEKVAD